MPQSTCRAAGLSLDMDLMTRRNGATHPDPHGKTGNRQSEHHRASESIRGRKKQHRGQDDGSAPQLSPAVHNGRRGRRATSEERLSSPPSLQARRPAPISQ